MIARCIHNKGAELGPPALGSFYSSGSKFQVEIGKEYEVAGLGIFKTAFIVLICDETGEPGWYPNQCFEIDAQALPPKWEFARLEDRSVTLDDPHHWVAIWGYPELVHDASHSDRLIEGDSDHLRFSTAS